MNTPTTAAPPARPVSTPPPLPKTTVEQAVNYVNGLVFMPELAPWLRAELDGQTTHLSCVADDSPTARIVRHYPLFSEEKRKLIDSAIAMFVYDWQASIRGWQEQTVRNLLIIALTLRTPRVKDNLITLVTVGLIEQISKDLYVPIFRTIAVLSNKADQEDRKFWKSLDTSDRWKGNSDIMLMAKQFLGEEKTSK